MARQSLTDRRRPQILAAFARCIGKTGIAGTSLEAVAAEAGMRRSILRHFVGNREELLRETAQFTVRTVDRQLPEFIGRLRQDIAEGMVSMDPFTAADSETDWIAVLDVFVAESGRYPAVAEIIDPAFRSFIGTVAACLRELHPAADEERSRAVAAGLIALRIQANCRQRLRPSAGAPEEELVAARILLTSLGPIRFPKSRRRNRSPVVSSGPPAEFGEETEIGVND